MADMGDYWRDTAPMRKEASKEKRTDNQQRSTELLRQNGIQFESKNGGIHLVVSNNGLTIDFWPSTGKWIARGRKHQGRGVFKLLSALKNRRKQPLLIEPGSTKVKL